MLVKKGSPPPAGSKKEVFRFRSVKSIGIALAKIGRDSKKRRAVSSTAQTNNGIRSNVISVERILISVVMNFTASRIDEILPSGVRKWLG